MAENRFSEEELRAEWARAAVLTSFGGSWVHGRRAAVLARFLLTEHA